MRRTGSHVSTAGTILKPLFKFSWGWLEKIPTPRSENRCEVGIGIFSRRQDGALGKISWATCRILVRLFDYRVKARQSARPKTLTGKGEVMPQYLVAIYHPVDYDPSVETEATIEEIHALNREMIAAGARVFAGGLIAPSNAKSLRTQPDGRV